MKVPFVDTRRLHGPDREALLAAFARVLDSGQYVQGGEAEAFEAEFGARHGPGMHAVAVANGTAALHLALQAHGIGPGDEVITVANTFIATAEAISLAGATPVFAEIEADSFNIDPADVARRITARTKAIIAVHLYGQLAQVVALRELCARGGLVLIEDACQAHGATLDGRAAGTFGAAAAFSFYPTKNVGTIGEGGLVLTGDAGVAVRMRSLRNHGQEATHVHAEPGYNYRLPELQAAALRVSLPRLDAWNDARIAAAARYHERLGGVPGVVLPAVPGDGSHVYHLYVIRVPDRDGLRAALASEGIATAIHYPTPIHLQPAYRAAGGGVGSLPQTEAAVAQILSLPMHPAITGAEIDAVAAAISRHARASGW